MLTVIREIFLKFHIETLIREQNYNLSFMEIIEEFIIIDLIIYIDIIIIGQFE